MPSWLQPPLLLSVLAVFLLGYGVSVVVRTRATARWRRRPSACAECRRDWIAGSERCGACGHAAPDSTQRKALLGRLAGVLICVLGVSMFGVALWLEEWLRDQREFGWAGPYSAAEADFG